MTIYFVRHGESVNNVARNYQGADVPLSDLGQRQAAIVAERLKHVSFDVILASSFTRAHDTAKTIQAVTGKPIEVLDSLVERRRPSAFHNKPYDDPELEKLRHFLDTHPDPQNHHSDEENFFDIKKRAQEVLQMLENRSEENIVVVSHGVFIKMAIMLIILKDTLRIEQFADSFHGISINNTAISICTFNKDHGWRVKTVNDFAHLAE